MGAKLYLLRHGQTYFNIEDRLGGDSPLTPKGFEHAEKVSSWLNEVDLAAIYCSTLCRSVQTAEVLHKYHSEIPLIKKPELRELSSGDFDSVSYADFEKKFPEQFEARKRDKYNWSFPNGESYRTIRERVKPTLDEIKTMDGNYAIVGHQGMNRAILGYLMNLPETETPFLVVPNDVIFVLDLQKSEISHIKDGNLIKGYVIDKSSKKADV